MKEVTITLNGQYIQDTDRVADALTKEGLRVKQVYKPVGVISGSADDSAIIRLRAHKEVAALREQGRIQIAPPHRSVQ